MCLKWVDEESERCPLMLRCTTQSHAKAIIALNKFQRNLDTIRLTLELIYYEIFIELTDTVDVKRISTQRCRQSYVGVWV